MKVLIVEDETNLQRVLMDFLSKEKYAFDAVNTYKDASEKISLFNYDCILLDINLPDASGFKLLDELKEINKTEGVIIISARDSIDDKIKGLNLGADDYLTKPFHLSELNARIQAVIRRKKFAPGRRILFANIEIDLFQIALKVDGTSVNLTKKEFDILQHLIANRNIVVSKNSIVEYIWGDYVDNSLSLDLLSTHLKNLKKKLKQANATIEIRNVYGVGYQIVEL
ncbi:MAG: response regulator transcription factor [Chitinophagales bacterium]|jgi:DNA-binding response OmpR family regulator|nr:response regulator transcription factor [Chitinophagales bacterium]